MVVAAVLAVVLVAEVMCVERGFWRGDSAVEFLWLAENLGLVPSVQTVVYNCF